ncbi:AAC(3) family N-acetyltransferase [Thermoflexus sp.]|uniref:AAC(3) family N-acetyltransferase n=1 Tax=Thermoflexus sp. TaxID=1969742 RepID=UPI001760546A|nr:AAC(3) family N-acetyltransferase [Thermoflexus sp.]
MERTLSPVSSLISFRTLTLALEAVRWNSSGPALILVAPEVERRVRGGLATILGAVQAAMRGNTWITPAFTSRTMVYPRVGPPDNGVVYLAMQAANARATFFQSDLPADPEWGPFPEEVRRLPGARRSEHPVLSFLAVGPQAEAAIAAQSLLDPWGPLRWLHAEDGDVLLVGADHTMNVAIHYVEALAGRKTFVRWALMDRRVVELPGFPGCRRGFGAAAPVLEPATRRVHLGDWAIQGLPLGRMVQLLLDLLRRDPMALLCEDPLCLLCHAVRQHVLYGSRVMREN